MEAAKLLQICYTRDSNYKAVQGQLVALQQLLLPLHT
jgi:hypothetical protein